MNLPLVTGAGMPAIGAMQALGKGNERLTISSNRCGVQWLHGLGSAIGRHPLLEWLERQVALANRRSGSVGRNTRADSCRKNIVMRMKPRLALSVTVSVLTAMLLAACTQDAQQPSAETTSTAAGAAAVVTQPADAGSNAPLDRAKAAAMAFSGRLRNRLQAAMAEGGPTAAVEVCHTEAPQIAAAVMAEHDLRLGRVAAPGRNRNPAHAADDWRLTTLQAFQQAVDEGAAAGEQLAVVHEDLPEGVVLRMMRGIATEPLCVACHGTEVAPEVRATILAHYPDDGATGFSLGDLRGALWVEVPAAVP